MVVCSLRFREARLSQARFKYQVYWDLIHEWWGRGTRVGPGDWGFTRLLWWRENQAKGEASNLPAHLHSNPHLWSWNLGNDQKNKTECKRPKYVSSIWGLGFALETGCVAQRFKLLSGIIYPEKSWRRAAAPTCWKEPVKVVEAFDWGASLWRCSRQTN